jgi:hypothetical protein
VRLRIDDVTGGNLLQADDDVTGGDYHQDIRFSGYLNQRFPVVGQDRELLGELLSVKTAPGAS